MLFLSAKSTRKEFHPDMILEILPKLMITHVQNLIKEFTHISILALRRLVNFIRLFHLCIELFPEVRAKLDAKIEEFLAHPQKRVKDYCSSLGDFLSFVTVSSKFKFGDILDAYLSEQMDRQAFWILQEIPELDHQDPKYKNKVVVLEEHRSEACFKTGLIGFHITLFYQYLNKIIIEQNYSNDPAKLIE